MRERHTHDSEGIEAINVPRIVDTYGVEDVADIVPVDRRSTKLGKCSATNTYEHSHTISICF